MPTAILDVSLWRGTNPRIRFRFYDENNTVINQTGSTFLFTAARSDGRVLWTKTYTGNSLGVVDFFPTQADTRALTESPNNRFEVEQRTGTDERIVVSGKIIAYGGINTDGTSATTTLTNDEYGVVLTSTTTSTTTVIGGPPGPANTLSIGTVTTGDAGTSAAATITGTAPTQTLNLTIPRGDTGNLNAASISVNSTTTAFQVNQAGAGYAMTVSGGFSGIGTSLPAYPLHVAAANPARGIALMVGNTTGTSQTGAQLSFLQAGVNWWTMGQPAATDAFGIWRGRHSGGDGTQYFNIDSTGKVAVGGSAAAETLGVNGGAVIGNQLSTGTSGSLRIIPSSGVVYLQVGQAMASASAAPLVVTPMYGGSEWFRITATGEVGIGVSSPVNKLQISGSFGRGAPVTKTANFTLAATENWVICAAATTLVATLPAASSWLGREVMLKTTTAQAVTSASSNVVPLAGGSAGTAILAATAGKWATLVSDGTNWIVMAGN